ncbi:MAG TPA: ATP-binding protein, partial [bacterium]|nr:ATP-binding protein [bacterium]
LLSMIGDRAVLTVTDNGPGVAPEDRTKVFERFYRAGDEMTRTTKGTGLGLYIVKRIVEAHRGTIDCQSAMEGGAAFTVSIPTLKK